MVPTVHTAICAREAVALDRLIGVAATFRRAVQTASVAAQDDATVLIAGETGTGKELFARAIHYISHRAKDPFVAVNCGALPDTLLEDELFGHERGAFTDAQLRRQGLIAQAGNGTLFLDEVDTLSARGQVALLRVIQDRTYRPLGSQQEWQSGVRFVAATNAPLFDLVNAGSFRADLYYRLCVFSVTLPPLRDRPEDIILLSSHFLRKHAAPNLAATALSLDAERALLTYAWPGNVRELENAIIRATRLAGSEPVQVEHLALPPLSQTNAAASHAVPASGTFRSLKSAAVQRFERDYLTRLMEVTRGNVTHAAQIAGKDRRDLGKLLKKHGLAGAFVHTRG